MDNNVCFEHDKKSPTEEMLAFSCEYHKILTESLVGNVVCDFELASGEFAWVNENTQHYESFGVYGTPKDSELYKRKTRGYCRESLSMKKMLLGGRNCTDSTQCLSMECDIEVGKCRGRAEGFSCSSHADCDKGMFCQQLEAYPYLSQCKKLRTPYDECQTTDQCQLNLYCWYGYAPDVAIDRKMCLPMYSQFPEATLGWRRKNFSFDRPQAEIEMDLNGTLGNDVKLTFEDFEINGRHCKSGLAF